MTDRPILFSAPMIRALLEGRKTQTRRELKVLNASMLDAAELDDGKCLAPLAKYAKGDRLWVRETHYRFGYWEPVPGVTTKGGREKWRFVATRKDVLFDAPAEFRKGRHHKDSATPAWHKRLARFMPRRFSRATLTLTEVRVQRLSAITEEDAQAESFKAGQLNDGFGPRDLGGGYTVESPGTYASAVGMFQLTWQELHPEWDGYSDPWVVALTFTLERQNIDTKFPSTPRLQPDGRGWICDQCNQEWMPGEAPKCEPCAAAWRAIDAAKVPA
jgi:hypothetical protein